MAEKRYISTEYLGKCETCRNLGSGGCNTYCDHGEEYCPDLKKIPTADVVEVVRCKECEHWVVEKDLGIFFCSYWASVLTDSQADDFCSYGKRKENTNEQKRNT